MFLKLEKKWTNNDHKSYSNCHFNWISSHLFTQCCWKVNAYWLGIVLNLSLIFDLLYFFVSSIFVYDVVCPCFSYPVISWHVWSILGFVKGRYIEIKHFIKYFLIVLLIIFDNGLHEMCVLSFKYCLKCNYLSLSLFQSSPTVSS